MLASRPPLDCRSPPVLYCSIQHLAQHLRQSSNCSYLHNAAIATIQHRGGCSRYSRLSQYSPRRLTRQRQPSHLCSAQDLQSTVEEVQSGKWKAHVLFCGVALALASVHRVTLPILAVPFQQEFQLSLPQMGVLQSAMLWGYVLGQIPSGAMADKYGGSPLMIVSLVGWCLVSGLTPLARMIPRDFVFQYIFLVRALLGLGQSGIVTGTSAMAARWVPVQHRSKAMGFCYFLYSGGVVVGLFLTPMVAKPFGWPAAFTLYVALGLLWAAWGKCTLAPETDATNPVQPRSPEQGSALGKKPKMSRSTKVQIAVLIWTHSVIGFGFTLLQNWIPTILATLGMDNLGSVGFLSALPWLAASGVSLVGGGIADWLHKEKGWSWVAVRRLCQNLASLGPAAALLMLAYKQQNVSITTAVALLVTTAGLQAFAYAGFHSYVQDVASEDAGRMLGLTNTGGTVVGVLCNLMTGNLAATSGGFTSVFAIAAVVYLSSFVTWNLFMKGEPVQLS